MLLPPEISKCFAYAEHAGAMSAASDQRLWILSQETGALFPTLPMTICVTYLYFIFFEADLSVLLLHKLLVGSGPLENTK